MCDRKKILYHTILRNEENGTLTKTYKLLCKSKICAVWCICVNKDARLRVMRRTLIFICTVFDFLQFICFNIEKKWFSLHSGFSMSVKLQRSLYARLWIAFWFDSRRTVRMIANCDILCVRCTFFHWTNRSNTKLFSDERHCFRWSFCSRVFPDDLSSREPWRIPGLAPSWAFKSKVFYYV